MRSSSLCLLIMTALIMAGCASAVSPRPPSSGAPGHTSWLGKPAYRLRASGRDKDAISNAAVARATEYCEGQGKQFKPIINRFSQETGLLGGEALSFDLYFNCVGAAELAKAVAKTRKKPKRAAAPADKDAVAVEEIKEEPVETGAAPAGDETSPEAEASEEVAPAGTQKILADKRKIKPGRQKKIGGGLPLPPAPMGGHSPAEGGLGEPESLGFDEAESAKAKGPATAYPMTIMEEAITE